MIFWTLAGQLGPGPMVQQVVLEDALDTQIHLVGVDGSPRLGTPDIRKVFVSILTISSPLSKKPVEFSLGGLG